MIDGGGIRRAKLVKYLGKTVDDKLTWAGTPYIIMIDGGGIRRAKDANTSV